MKSYELITLRMKDSFAMYVAAVSGLRAMSQGAGLQGHNPSVRGSIERMRDGFMSEAKATLLRFAVEHQVEDVDELSGRSDARMLKVINEIGQIANQVASKTNREMAIGAGNLADAMKSVTPALGELLQKRMASPRFEVKDTSGRSWDAAKLFGTVVRDFAYQTVIDAEFAEAVRSDADQVHVSDGTSINLGADWLAKRDEVFHINSRKEVADGPVQA
jgi:hypothetical protein